MSGYSRKNLGVIRCPKCNYETEWEDGEEFNYVCECCGHKFRLVTEVHYQFKIRKREVK